MKRTDNNLKNLIIIATALITLFACNYYASAITKKAGPVDIEYQSADGFNMTGLLDIPAKASIKHKVPLVIFIHSIGMTKDEWQTYPQNIKALGVATLCLDLRGHGKSIVNKFEKKRYWPAFEKKDYEKFPGDVNAVFNYLKEDYPEVNTSKVAIIGSNLGATTGILAGSTNNRNIKTLVLLSPMIDFKGIDVRIPTVAYGKNPVLIMVSKNDRKSYLDAEELIKYAQGKKVIKVYPFGGNGAELLRFQNGTQTEIINWLKANFLGIK